MSDGPNSTGLLTTVWTALLTAFGVVCALLIRRVWTDLDRKADKDVLAERDALAEQRHQENLERFDSIIERMDKAEERAGESRHNVGNALNALALQVAVLNDRAGVDHKRDHR